jgi:pimeloyl-ACP methyl ester carboxylesterase
MTMVEWIDTSASKIKHLIDRAVDLRSEAVGGALDLTTSGVDQLNKTLQLNSYLLRRGVEAGVAPGLDALLTVNGDLYQTTLRTLAGVESPLTGLRGLGGRLRSGLRYDRLVKTWGKELFGSASFEGERRLVEDDHFSLSFLPPAKGVEPAGVALFHVGGYLPYSDLIFRALPEANFFAPFLERGVPVYAMELRRDGCAVSNRSLGEMTLERFIDRIDRLSDVAFAHSNRHAGVPERKMLIEGYCGLAMPTLCYLAAKPQQADTKFKVALILTAPVDGRRCSMLAELLQLLPPHLLVTQLKLSQLLGGYVPGDNLRAGIDIPLGSFFGKSSLGRFASGWERAALGGISSIDDLDPAQRLELALAYWISPENCKRHPMPLDVVRPFLRLFIDGIDRNLEVPASYRGKPLRLTTILEETEIQLAGLYGGKDPVVPSSTAQGLVEAMGDRYTHVVHEKAGHITYIICPQLWNAGLPVSLSPNPLEVALELYQR